MINHINGDYFVDCGLASQPYLRAAFGVWITIYAAVVAYCARSIFRSRLAARLLSNDPSKRKIGIWVVLPAATPSEVFELRAVLFRALRRGNVSYVIVSLFCVAAAIVSAAATTIANHTVVQHTVIRRTNVSGRVAQSNTPGLAGLLDRITERVDALNRAHAPIDQLFDFIPDDDSNWVFVSAEWNNTWLGNCSLHKYPAADLMVLNTVSPWYQDLVPALGPLLPPWATVDPNKQGSAPIASTQGVQTNNTGAWRDVLLTFTFGSAPSSGNASLSTTNISFANILVHDVGIGGNGTLFLPTAFKSDVHVAECTFNNTSPNENQARADEGDYGDVAKAISSVYTTYVAETSAQGQSIVQPTAQDMLRNWQAYQMINHGYYMQPGHRQLSASVEVVQIRLSVLTATVISLALVVAVAVAAHFSEPLDEHGEHLAIPKSQLDWIVEAARQQHVEGEQKSHIGYAKERDDLFFTVSTARRGLSRSRITSNRDKSITQPFLGYHDPYTPYDTFGGDPATSAVGEGKPIYSSFEGDFNPYYPHDNSSAVPPPSRGGFNSTIQPFMVDFDPYALYDSSERVLTTATPSHGWRGR